MNTLYDLTKKIDSLTYNSQQVLNALIRSCIASGSSSGYRVKKYGQTIELTREDIYCLYTFYEEWKAAGFPEKSDDFYALLDRADRMFSSTETPSTAAVVKHSKILYMTDTNAEDGDEKWLERIRESAAPAATVSTAPIPLNLRTPLYDENMSTKSFSQYETYLFPLGYQRNELLGTPGNGEDYVAGGRNWMIDASDTLMLTGRHIVAGSCRNPQNRKDAYGDSAPTLGWGLESYASGDSAFALGNRVLAIGDYSGATGDRSVAYGIGSLALGGESVRATGDGSLAANRDTASGGDYSVAMNRNSVTGGWPYEFTFDTVVTTEDVVSTGCDYYFDENTNACVMTSAVSAAQQASSKNVLYVTANQANASGLGKFDIAVGDQVYVYDLAYMKDGVTVNPTDDAGFAFKRILATVIELTGNMAEGYRIVLDNPVKADDGKYGNLVGGKVAACGRNLAVYDDDGNLVDREFENLGGESVALNHSTVARGPHQTVVGMSNVPNDEARFIVGVGTPQTSLGAPVRKNGLLVADRYGYMKLADGHAIIGLSTGEFKSHDDTDDSFYMYKGVFMGTGISSGTAERTFLEMSDDGVELSYTKRAAKYGELLLGKSGVKVTTDGTLDLNFGNLALSGNTFGSLTATDQAESFTLTKAGDGTSSILDRMGYAQATGRSGFYYCKPDDEVPENETEIAGSTANWPDHSGSHVISSTVNGDSGYETALIAIPGVLNDQGGTALYHPLVSVAHYNTPAGNLQTGTQTKELAYLDEVDGLTTRVTTLENRQVTTRMSSGLFAYAGFQQNNPSNYSYSGVVEMPGLFMTLQTAGSTAWKNMMHVYPKALPSGGGIAPNTYAYEYDIYEARDTTQSSTYMFNIKRPRYSLSGNQLTLSFCLWQPSSVAEEYKNTRGLAFPICIGAAVEKIAGGEFRSLEGTGLEEDFMYGSRMHGTVQEIDEFGSGAGFHFLTHTGVVSVADSQYPSTYGGSVVATALSDGNVMMYIESPGQYFKQDTAYSVSVTGTVPFIAAQKCTGTTIVNNGVWAGELKPFINNNSKHLSYYNWRGTTNWDAEQGDLLSPQGQLNRLYEFNLLN